jgi:23S rRNA (cytidine1920-2'-O)/16S rRNA (cytidine1409-2'-O)-methyltransferase
LQGLTFSPITGGEGNIEFLAYWTLDKPLEKAESGESGESGESEASIETVLDSKWLKKVDEIVLEATSTFKGTSKAKQ